MKLDFYYFSYQCPLNKSFLEQVSNGTYPIESPYCPKLSDNRLDNTIEPLNLDNVGIACDCCGNKTQSNCVKKESFYPHLI